MEAHDARASADVAGAERRPRVRMPVATAAIVKRRWREAIVTEPDASGRLRGRNRAVDSRCKTLEPRAAEALACS